MTQMSLFEGVMKRKYNEVLDFLDNNYSNGDVPSCRILKDQILSSRNIDINLEYISRARREWMDSKNIDGRPYVRTAKLTDARNEEIVKDILSGITDFAILSEKYNIAKHTIRGIIQKYDLGVISTHKQDIYKVIAKLVNENESYAEISRQLGVTTNVVKTVAQNCLKWGILFQQRL